MFIHRDIVEIYKALLELICVTKAYHEWPPWSLQSVLELSWWSLCIPGILDSESYCRGSVLLRSFYLTFLCLACVAVPSGVLYQAMTQARRPSMDQKTRKLLAMSALLQEILLSFAKLGGLQACLIPGEQYVSCWTWYSRSTRLLEGCCQPFHISIREGLCIGSTPN